MHSPPNDIINQYYHLAINDYINGLELEELQIILFEYEKKEMYLECAGIQRAIEYIKLMKLIKKQL